MNLTAIAVTACLAAAVIRVVVSITRKDPAGEVITQATGAGLSAAALMVGFAVAPYYLVTNYYPSLIQYGDTLKDPLFITVSGIAYALLGGVTLVRFFQNRKA